MHFRRILMLVVMAAALAGSLAADPIPDYVATSASLTYTSASTTDESFSFAGPDLNLSGTGYSEFTLFSFTITPGVPFVFTAYVIENEDGASISGTTGGLTLPPDTFFPFGTALLTAPGVVFNLPGGIVPPPFAPAILPVTVPAIAEGTVSVCALLSCQFSGPPETEFHFTMNIPGVVTLQIVNYLSTDHPAYRISSAQFTPVPEPNTAVLCTTAIVVSICCIRVRRRLDVS